MSKRFAKRAGRLIRFATMWAWLFASLSLLPASKGVSGNSIVRAAESDANIMHEALERFSTFLDEYAEKPVSPFQSIHAGRINQQVHMKSLRPRRNEHLTRSVITFAMDEPEVVYVDDDWEGEVDGEIVTFPGGVDAIMGENAFFSIQEAIGAVAEGGTVRVAPGTFDEGVIIEKSVKLLGDTDGHTAIIASTGLNFGLYVSEVGDDEGTVVIEGFTFKTKPAEEDDTVVDVYISASKNVRFANNKLEGDIGAVVLESERVTISNNSLQNDGALMGIMVENNNSEIMIVDNHIEATLAMGIYDSHDVSIVQNHVRSPLGIAIIGVDDVVIQHNFIEALFSGVSVGETRGIKIESNQYLGFQFDTEDEHVELDENVQRLGLFGFDLYESSDATIQDNDVEALWSVDVFRSMNVSIKGNQLDGLIGLGVGDSRMITVSENGCIALACILIGGGSEGAHIVDNTLAAEVFGLLVGDDPAVPTSSESKHIAAHRNRLVYEPVDMDRFALDRDEVDLDDFYDLFPIGKDEHYGVFVMDGSYEGMLDATANWWGHPTGPQHVDNPNGKGVKVSDHVLFDRWYTNATLTRLSDEALRHRSRSREDAASASSAGEATSEEDDAKSVTFSIDPSRSTSASVHNGVLGMTVHVPIGAATRAGTMTITALESHEQPTLTPGRLKIGEQVYQITAVDEDGQPLRQFARVLEFVFEFDGVDLPGGARPENLQVFYWDERLNEWILVPSELDRAAGTVTASVDHLTVFALMATDLEAPTDIQHQWFEADVLKLVSLGVVSGYEDGTFRPDQVVTRAEFSKLLVEALGFSPETTPTLSFADAVSIPDWAAGYVATAARQGWVHGFDDHTFRANASVTREQVAALIARAAQLTGSSSLPFADADTVAEWAHGYVAGAVEASIVNGFADNTFRPTESATRAQTAAIITRLIELRGGRR